MSARSVYQIRMRCLIPSALTLWDDRVEVPLRTCSSAESHEFAAPRRADQFEVEWEVFLSEWLQLPAWSSCRSIALLQLSQFSLWVLSFPEFLMLDKYMQLCAHNMICFGELLRCVDKHNHNHTTNFGYHHHYHRHHDHHLYHRRHHNNHHHHHHFFKYMQLCAHNMICVGELFLLFW